MNRNRLQMPAIALVICLLAPFVSAQADQFDEASQWLVRMSKAMNELDYQGTFVYVQGADIETMRLTHIMEEGAVHERLNAVSGPPRELIRDKEGLRVAINSGQENDSDPMMSGSVFPEFSAQELLSAKWRYMFKVGGTGRVAGHTGRKISIIPKDNFRFGYELWLDEGTGLLLRWVLYDPNRQALAKLMFTDLVWGASVDRQELKASYPAGRFATLTEASMSAVSPNQTERELPQGLPVGFRLVSRHAPAQENGLEHMVFSDGLASVSVYIEPLGDAGNIASGLSRLGTTSAWSKTAGDRQVTVIGEVPSVTVKRMGNAFLRSVKP